MEKSINQLNLKSTPFSKELALELKAFCSIRSFKKGAVLIRKDSFLSVVPIILSGLVKVYTTQTDTDRELLLYYVKENESCIMTLTTAINHLPSKIEAIAESDTEILFVPSERIEYLMTKYPTFNKLFYSQYNIRYLDLLDTINSLVFDGLDTRLLHYLKEKFKLSKGEPLSIKHKDMAADLGTAREVITRLLKKLEIEGKIKTKDKVIIFVKM